MVVTNAKKTTASKRTTKRTPGSDSISAALSRERSKVKRLIKEREDAIYEYNQAKYLYRDARKSGANTPKYWMEKTEKNIAKAKSTMIKTNKEINESLKKIKALEKKWYSAWGREDPKARNLIKSINKR